MDIALVMTYGQQYNVGEKPTVTAHLDYSPCRNTRKTVKTKQKQCSKPLNMVVIIYYYIGCKYKATIKYMIFKRVPRW